MPGRKRQRRSPPSLLPRERVKVHLPRSRRSRFPMQRPRASPMFCPSSLLRPARGARRAPRPPPPRAGGRRQE
eukprot:8700889-Alexandrium_andersonii.AAC.1